MRKFRISRALSVQSSVIETRSDDRNALHGSAFGTHRSQKGKLGLSSTHHHVAQTQRTTLRLLRCQQRMKGDTEVSAPISARLRFRYLRVKRQCCIPPSGIRSDGQKIESHPLSMFFYPSPSSRICSRSSTRPVVPLAVPW